MKLVKANTVIKINGKTYADSDEMPKQFQSILKDENQNGLPDIAEQAIEGKLQGVDVKMNIEPKIIIKGQHYSSWDEVPPEYQKYREKAEGIQKKLKAGNLSDLFSLIKQAKDLKGFNASATNFGPDKSKIVNSESKWRIAFFVLAIVLVILGYAYFF